MSEIANILPSAGQLTKTGWQLPETLTEADWRLAGSSIARVEGAMMWWLGDLWNYGGHKYGDRKALVESDDWDGPSYETCRNVAAVCNSFEMSRRRDVVTFSHHQESSSLPPDEADKILDWCEQVFGATGRLPTIKATRERAKNIKAWLAQGWNTNQLERKALVEQGFAVVASQRKDEAGKETDAALMAWADQQGLLQKIDRNTDWGNPFEMHDEGKENKDGTRAEVCQNFAEHYLPRKPSLLKKIPKLKGKVLVCWCYPEQCHGDHLAGMANDS